MTTNATTHVLSGAVTDLKFSPDGSMIYAAVGETIKVIDVATGTVVTSYDLGLTLQGFDISPDGQHLAVSVSEGNIDDTASFVWIDLSTGSMETFTYGSSYSHDYFHDVAYLADGTLLLSHAGRGPLRQFDFATGEFFDASEELQSGPTLISSPDVDQLFMVGGYTTYVYTTGEGITANDGGVYDPYGGASVPSPNVRIGAISPDGASVVRGSTIYDANLGVQGELGSFAGRANGFVFSPDGQTLYSADPGGRIVVYEVATWRAVAVIDSGRATTSDTAFGDVLQISPDGSHLAVISDSGFQIIDLELAVPEATNGDDVLGGTGTGVNGIETLIGLDGNDTLGGGGYQIMYGGRGDDVYYFDRDEVAAESAGEGYDIIYTEVSTETGDNVEELIYVGTGDAILRGGAGSQTLRGGDGNDSLYGFLGADLMVGGSGDDTYSVSQSGDVIVEEAGGGYDTVETLLDYYELPGNFERLQQVGSVGGTLIGNALDNEIIGYALDDYLVGARGNDVLIGQYGNDLLTGNNGNDILNGQGDDDVLSGGAGADTLTGGAGSDILEGGLGDDQIDGGTGVDDLFYANADSRVVVSLALQGGGQNTRAEGRDTLISIENLFGSDFDDRLEGDAGANTLDGRFGDDRLLGGAGDDHLFGVDGHDRLSGGAGFDWLHGGVGNDVYYLDAADDTGDRISEAPGEGEDTVWAASYYALGDNIENLQLRYGNWYGTGNALDNTIRSSGGNNVLSGLDGNDTIVGGTGRDTLDGGDGNDRLFGGIGLDLLTGGEGRDRFVFDDAIELGDRVGNSDIIADFVGAEGDRINLADIDAVTGTPENDAFTFIGSGAFTGTAGEARYYFDGGRTVVEMDTNGDSIGDLFLRLEGEIDLAARDFYF